MQKNRCWRKPAVVLSTTGPGYFSEGTPQEKPLEGLGLLILHIWKCLGDLFNSTPKSFWKNILQVKSTAPNSYFVRPQPGLGIAPYASGRIYWLSSYKTHCESDGEYLVCVHVLTGLPPVACQNKLLGWDCKRQPGHRQSKSLWPQGPLSWGLWLHWNFPHSPGYLRHGLLPTVTACGSLSTPLVLKLKPTGPAAMSSSRNS